MFETLFAPRGVAVVGASQNPSKLGYGVARNLIVSGYEGELHFVNPRGGSLFDRPIYPDLASVPDPVDLAIIIIPAASVPNVLEDCGRRGIRYAIIGSGGFREVGAEGEALERKCLAIARAHGIRVLGPNCIGYLDTHLPIDTTFLPLPGPIPGDIAFLSHSGAICEAVIDWARGQGFGLSRLVSLGNQMDLNEGELLPAVAADPNTRVVAMYMEGVGDGPMFIEHAQKVTREKPVIAIKVGVSEAGRVAVASHTGALAGQDNAYDAAFRKAGVIRARHSEEMFDWAQALAWCPLPPGPRMAILTNAGGPGAIAADALVVNDLQLATLEETTRERLHALLPPAASTRNPVDMLAGAGPREYAEGLRALLEDAGVDGVIVILPPPPMITAAEVAGAILPVIRSAVKPVVVTLMGEELIAHAARLFRQSHIPDYRFPERAVSAMRVLVQRSKQLEVPPTKSTKIEGVRTKVARRSLKEANVGDGGFIDAAAAAEIVEAYGITTPPGILASTVEQAVQAAENLGYPVALKIASADIPHKSDIGGVILGVDGPEAVSREFPLLVERSRKAVPEADIQGVVVQPLIQEGQEVILGMVRDEQFGPLVMFGSGGVEVEALRDVAFELAPLSRYEAEEMLARTWAGRRLEGFRNLPAVDRDAVIDALLRISRLALDLTEVAEVEINPLRVFLGEGGVLALDVRLRVNGNHA
ncbi:MAG: CoA-binding protein [Anaerolineales bacterium]|nr:CoA-binding protein [Anaerolineales bacterium]